MSQRCTKQLIYYFLLYFFVAIFFCCEVLVLSMDGKLRVCLAG
jgi:hypothetical protein